MSPGAYFSGSSGQAGSSAGPGGHAGAAVGTSYSTSLSRAEHYDVVLEAETASAILPHLGAIVLDQMGSMDDSEVQLDGDFDRMPRSGSGSSISAVKSHDVKATGGRTAAESADRFESLLQELIVTERSYVRRVETLYKRYAVPLRQLARDRDTAIIPLYEAQRLFGNIGEVLGANAAFLNDLQGYLEAHEQGKRSISLGEVIYRNVACFSCYNEYLGNFEKAKHIEQTMTKTNRAYREFVDRTKASTSGLGNVGLRELIMEPVQRIPRYTMLLDGMVKTLPMSDPTRGRLEEAIVLASRIASCEVDDKTKRAAVLWSFARNVDGFPAGLISVHRQFIDCIDVDDFPIDVLGPAAMSSLLSPAGSTASSPSYRTLHCTLFLFDDVIAITKRASMANCGKTLIGLDDLNRLADQMKSFTERRNASTKISHKVELGFRGLIDLADVLAADIGGPDFQIAMAKAPSHISGEKWASRLIRQYATADTVSLSGPDPAVARSEKYRFLENLWRAQALLKAREYRSHVRSCVVPSSCNEDKVRRVVYWNVYSRRSYLTEPHKSLAVLHVDPAGEGDCLPFGHESTPPGAIVRIHDVDEDKAQCLYSVSNRAAAKDDEEEVAGAGTIAGQPLALGELADQLYKAAKEAANLMRDFEPCIGGSPSTPTSSHRGRNLATGLEQFGRSLFGTPNSIRSTGTGSEFFGARRSRSKGSSNVSRNPSTSTRLTYSTANTSSIGSRDMLRTQGLDFPGSEGIKSSIERYRQMADDTTPKKPDPQSESPSPVKRKPVPDSADQSPQRASSGSKRAIPYDATPTEKPSKRPANGWLSADDEPVRSLSPSPTKRPTGPRAASITSRRNSVAPLRVRKDLGQAREPSREERIQSTWKDLEALRQSIVANREELEALAEMGGDEAREMVENCALEQEGSAERLLRLRDNLVVLLQDSGPTTTTSRASEVQKLESQVSSLTRKCELLSELEKDGRLENTELHKAFNEELDQMYDDVGLGEVEQIAKLRAEVKRAKGQRNEANVENKALQRELALEKAQGEVWKALLEANGLF